jgi:hypothetical protein
MVTYPLEQFEEWFRITGKWWSDLTDQDNPIIHVQGDVKLKWTMPTKKLPYQFGEVSGNFDCHATALQELTGCPTRVGGNFDAGWNLITNLVGGPRWVGGHYHVQECALLENVQDVADHVGTTFRVGWRPSMHMMKPFMNSHKVILDRTPQYSTWDDIHNMQLVQTVFDEHAGKGRAGVITVAGTLIRMGFPQTARM